MRHLVWVILVAFVLSYGGAVSRASPEDDDSDQLVHNASFELPGEEGARPEGWEGPVTLEDEHDPVLAALTQETNFEVEDGDFVAYLRYRSTIPEGWVGVAYEQTSEQLSSPPAQDELYLNYRIRYQYSSGVDHISDHAGMVEVELRSEEETYRLRYLHPRQGELPQGADDVSVVDAGDPGYRTWVQYDHDLGADVAKAFPDLEGYEISGVRIGVLTRRAGNQPSSTYWLFDEVQLVTERR